MVFRGKRIADAPMEMFDEKLLRSFSFVFQLIFLQAIKVLLFPVSE